ncbi:uncharacterized protein LOC129302737 [Prosopis cineraria]|uniref:uncharacterized protein LOC129302737 n=1 Tax=Prosopis cineraria TaxID=364024 RepID=UPI00240FF4A2|nr:uncharacterized protein LOC129302737 [Prosopis cineraria]
MPHDVCYQLEENLKEIDQKRPTKKLRKEENNPLEVDDKIVQEIIPSSSSQLDKKKASAVGDKFFAPRTSSGAQPRIQSAFIGKEVLHRVDYDCCILMNAINFVYYQPMIDVISAISPGYKGPTYHAVRTKLLQDIKKKVQSLVDECRSFWAETGCTIMAYGWQDQRNRQLINFLVYCPRGMVFIKSVDASDIVKDAQNFFNLVMDMVAFAGADNIVYLVTDNATNYKATGRLLNDKFPSIFWSSCTAHCLNLILSYIGKMEIVSSLATRASMVSKFIYNHVFLLAWLRKREDWTEIIRPSATQFGTTFIALKSIYEYRHDIQALITSKTFVESRYYKDSKAKAVTMIVLDNQVANKKKALDLVDYESIDQIDYWVMEEDDCSLLNIDDIEQDLIYDDTVLPKAIIHQEDEEDNKQRGNVAHGEAISGLDLQLFSQKDIDSFSEDVDAFEPTHAWINQNPPIFDKP